MKSARVDVQEGATVSQHHAYAEERLRTCIPPLPWGQSECPPSLLHRWLPSGSTHVWVLPSGSSLSFQRSSSLWGCWDLESTQRSRHLIPGNCQRPVPASLKDLSAWTFLESNAGLKLSFFVIWTSLKPLLRDQFGRPCKTMFLMALGILFWLYLGRFLNIYDKKAHMIKFCLGDFNSVCNMQQWNLPRPL